jgi:hypothetical protein
MKNPLWAKFEEWRLGAYDGAPLPEEQARQIECAFFAGVACCANVSASHGYGTVIEAVNEHCDRQKS